MSLIKSVGVLSAGQGIAQLISLIGYISLARIYEPEHFGVFALILSLSTMLSGVSSFRYEMTILLPKSRLSAELASNLSFFLSISVHLICAVFFILISIVVNFWSVENCIFVVLISFFNSILNISIFIQNREKRYKTTAVVSIVRNTCFICFAILLWQFNIDINGLVLSYLFSITLLSTYLFFSEFNLKTLASLYKNNHRLKVWLFKHNDFFKFTAPAVFCNLAAQNIPILLISIFYGDGAVGMYSMVQRVIVAPVSFISGSVNRVYTQHISELRYKQLKIYGFTCGLIRNISIPVLLICILSLYLFYAGFLELVFGHQWKGIDDLAIIFIPVMGISFVSKAVAGFAVLGHNFLGLIYQVVLLVFVSSSLGLVYLTDGGESAAYGALSVTLSIIYLAQVFSILGISKSMDRENLI